MKSPLVRPLGISCLIREARGANKIRPSPYQPRREFDDTKLEELASSIKSHGLLQPVVIRIRPDGAYELIAGERRLRASALAGLNEIPAIVENVGDKDASTFALIENLQREDLNPLEEASGYHRLQEEFGLTQDEVASSTGKARSTVANSLRILSLPASVLELLALGKIEKGHAKLLATMSPGDAESLAKQITKNGLSIKELSSQISNKNNTKASKPKSKDSDLLNIEKEMSESFGHKIEIETKNKKSGKVSITYNTLDELDNIISKMKNK